MVNFSVSKSAPELVAPCEPTPSGDLPLSFLDRKMRFLLGTVLVFSRGAEEATKLIKEGLSKALVYYYPIAGRFVDSRGHKGEIEVACTGEGVWFTVASANCTLEDVNHLNPPLLLPRDDLVPQPPAQAADTRSITFMMQVTEFTCGGFVIGIRSSHAMTDGVGAAHFLNAVLELARGAQQPSVEPTWSREAFPSPPRQAPPPCLLPPPPSFPLVIPGLNLEPSIVDLSPDAIATIKSQFTSEKGKACSTFDVIAAVAWKCRTLAINLDPDAHVRLGFAASARHILHDVLPQDKVYYGNCVHPVRVTSSSSKIAAASVFEIINLIRAAKSNLAAEFSSWVAGDQKEDPYAAPLMDYGTFFLTDWTRTGFYEMDHGWGKPLYVSPVDDDGPIFIPSCLVLKPPSLKQGIRLLARCVTKEHAAAFHDELMKLG